MNINSNDIKRHYDESVQAKSGMQYERDRWFKDSESRAGYDMTSNAIERVLRAVSYSTCFELGPGAGTWTALLCRHEPEAAIDVLDISEHMLKMAREKTKGTCRNIRFIQHDFLTFTGEKTYDFFFSSRVFEYFSDKRRAAKIIAGLLKPNGAGMLITKYPRYFGYKARGVVVPEMHRLQIAPKELQSILREAGLRVDRVVPVTLTFPVLRSALFHRAVHALLGRLPFCFLHTPFCESYAVVFSKP